MSEQRSIFIPESAIANDDYLVEEFFRFVHYCVVNQRFCDFAIVKGPEVDAYCAVYYEAQVNNGGHAQFVANSGNNMHIFEAALSGLDDVGAKTQAALVRGMIAWVRANPDDAEKLVNNHTRPEPLDRLDDQFFAANGKEPIKARVKAWIKRSPNLKVISDRAFLDLLENPSSIQSR